MAKRDGKRNAGQGGEPTSPNGAADFLPAKPSLPAAREASAACRGCGLFRRATQTVFGEGASHARIMLVGETPGDREDVVGRPFVGPAGQLLDRALDAAKIDRSAVYVTNVVKHFKWEPRGKRRLHKRPLPSEIAACMPWLRMEIDLVRPEIIVCLGATAGQALFGSRFSVTRERGRFLSSSYAPFVLATLHPSALLRISEPDERHAAFEHFVADLSLVHDAKVEASP
ncbi:MAG TPA: UdgX family uracil-DNA binding protein [Gammaproteobacteria bacterium]|jgi:uracil-DNA glycosylase family protein|nr:UdgX family uracil-DNA binding protein [Gammaproteobacteria bacterium]